MSKVVGVDISNHSFDNSGDGDEILGMVDEGSFGSGEDKTHLMSQSFLDSAEDDAASYTFKDISGRLTYRFVSHDSNNADDTPGGPYYVIGNPVEVFGATTTTQKKVIPRDPIQAKAMTAKKRDDKRRATHNEVERRRRDKINNWITRLAALVPGSGQPDAASKGGILAKACDYINELRDKTKRLEQVENENEKLGIQLVKLNQEVAQLLRENNSLRSQIADNCIVTLQRPKQEKS